ncbi:hypothetical protein GDO81_021907 [Engystomops pustulosus]|uniref:Uncharacterized protein n=1 Tax=Engystomops pustulosus TaxID=76066 RepID=A0AAV6ZNT5_ENGPU|nr:hypothetical protein GDO81_021907 [Engystomops pustulosus]
MCVHKCELDCNQMNVCYARASIYQAHWRGGMRAAHPSLFTEDHTAQPFLRLKTKPALSFLLRRHRMVSTRCGWAP